MVIRVWRARAAGAGLDAYRRHFEGAVLPELKTLRGFSGATLSHREAGDAIEVMVETRWSSRGDIEAFAGQDIDAAVVEQEARDALVDYDTRVQHYDVLVHDGAR